MQEEWRQHQDRNCIRPVEHPVEPIESAVEREGERPEECEAQPEEVERCFVARPAIPHGRRDEQRENPDCGEHVVERGVAARQRNQRDLACLARVQPEHGVTETAAGLAAMERANDIVRPFDWLEANRQQHIASPDAGLGARPMRRDFSGSDPGRSDHPEHAVIDLIPRRSEGDVGEAQAEERRDQGRRRQ
jgi:hypothetical protein